MGEAPEAQIEGPRIAASLSLVGSVLAVMPPDGPARLVWLCYIYASVAFGVTGRIRALDRWKNISLVSALFTAGLISAGSFLLYIGAGDPPVSWPPPHLGTFLIVHAALMWSSILLCWNARVATIRARAAMGLGWLSSVWAAVTLVPILGGS